MATEWKETGIQNASLDLIARVACRAFLGEELCRSEEWLMITKDYTRDGFRAAQQLSTVPERFKFLLPLFSQKCKVVRNQVRRAQEIIQPVIENRRRAKEQARKENKLESAPEFNDAIEWGEVDCKGIEYDPAYLQLSLSFAAIHATADLLTKTMLLLADNPKAIESLREEILRVLKKEGWRKTTFQNLKLVDSTLKEVQRMMPNDRSKPGHA
jgi:cytochrome P450